MGKPYNIPDNNARVNDRSKQATKWACGKQMFYEREERSEGFVSVKIVMYIIFYEFQTMVDNAHNEIESILASDIITSSSSLFFFSLCPVHKRGRVVVIGYDILFCLLCPPRDTGPMPLVY